MTRPLQLDPSSLPLRDYHKAKRLMWNPQELSFVRDRADYQAMTDDEKRLVHTALALFIGGEVSVTHDLAPLLIALKREGGPLEEALFVTTQLFEEAKHVEFFAAALDAIGLSEVEPLAFAGASYPLLFGELDRALDALLTDPSPKTQVEAIVTYHMIVEGVLAETGYYAIFKALRARGIMPGLTAGLELLQRDEARHIAFGLHLITRHLKADPTLWDVIDSRLNRLMTLAQGVYLELFSAFSPEIPFGLDLGDVLTFAGRQYRARLSVLERARQGLPSLEESAA